MKTRQDYPNRLPLKNLYNLRDIGGYMTRDGKITPFGRFLRSEAPLYLTDPELAELMTYPLQSVIDLRSPNEARHQPHALSHVPGIRYERVALLGSDINATVAQADALITGRPSTLGDLYLFMLEHSKKEFARIFKIFEETQDGAVLFHCTHGKDRTGLVAMLLLLLAGVSDHDIIANYQVSRTYLQPLFDQTADQIPDSLRPYLNSDASNMEQALEWMHGHFPTAADYLSSCGVSRSTMDVVRARLIG
ncbi:MAG: tyrosine-protein phosphatase [Eubacteriales bacterium]|nr:tyrosine-protein phosphatase [Eubacteriales bacterium]